MGTRSEKNFWQSKRVLVTGAGGFVGLHLAKHLEVRGAWVLGMPRREDGVDIVDRSSLESYFQKKPSIVFHLAGEALVEKGQEDPYKTFRTNFMGTLNVLELSRVARVPRIVIASTAHVYGVGKPPFTEDDPPRPSRPYETSKTATDLLAQSYADSFQLPVVIPRFVNIYGPGDTNRTRLIPKAIGHILQDEPVPLWGGRARREYLYIDDAVAAYLQLAEMDEGKLEKNRIFNFGAGQPVTAAELVRRIGRIAGVPVRITKAKEERVGEIPEQYVSREKAKRVLGWRPKIRLDEGLRQTIEWYRMHA